MKDDGLQTCLVSTLRWLDKASITLEGMDSESMAIMNALAWDNAQAWISPDDLYFLSPESEATFEAI